MVSKRDATFDTSFWINAHRCGLLHHMLDRFSLHFAPAVGAEMRTTFAAGRDFWARVRAGELIEAPPAEVLVREHGLGERHALSLAIEHPDWLLLIDDFRPFQEAQRRGLQTLCTPTFAVMLCGEGVIADEQAFVVLARLVAMRTVNLELLLPALAQLREMVDGA